MTYIKLLLTLVLVYLIFLETGFFTALSFFLVLILVEINAKLLLHISKNLGD